MTLFEDILREMYLLTEDASVNDINDAITNMHPVWIKYDDSQGGGGKNKRLICPIAYGISTAGNPVIRAFQLQGSSKRDGNNSWKLFRLDRVKFWRNINSRTYNPENLVGMNKDDDAQMQTVYTISPIGKASQINKPASPQLKATPITKKDVENIETPEAQETPDNYTAHDAVNAMIKRIKQQEPQNTVDNETQDTYTVNNNAESQINAPETRPVFKSDITNPEQGEENTEKENDTTAQKQIGDDPITKQEVNGEELTDKDKISMDFKDLMDRMENINKDEKE